jgi:threonine dehydratase
MSLAFDEILRAILTSRVYELARETPLEVAPRLSKRLGNTVWLKREDQQPIFSFKIRGAYNRIARLSQKERAAGVITASAGNHAQGVALSAKHLGIHAVIVMPKTTPEIKVEAVRALDAEVILAGDHYSEAQLHCDRLAQERGLTFVHPFDDPLVIAGQGTIADEIARQHPRELAAIFVPVGGGGLIAGIGAYVKSVIPDVQVIGVEPVDSDAMKRSLKAGHPVSLESPRTAVPSGMSAGIHFPSCKPPFKKLLRSTMTKFALQLKISSTIPGPSLNRLELSQLPA